MTRETNSEKNNGENKGKLPNKGWANLKPAKKGEVRNPKGRPKGRRDFNTLVDEAIEYHAEEYVRVQNGKNPKRKITRADVDIEGDIFRQFLNKARNGDLKAIDSFLDRRHGRATQPIKLAGMVGSATVTPENVEKVTAEIDGWFAMWDKKPNANTSTSKGAR